MEHMRSITQPWRCKDGRWYLPHFNLPHLHDRVIGVLGCESNADAVAKAIAKWDSHDLEEAVAAARACGSIVRSNSEWLSIRTEKCCPASRSSKSRRSATATRSLSPKASRPLSGIKVLDLTRILAGPIAARTLAENGADVLMVTAQHLPQVPEHVMDTSHGKRSCFLNLNKAEDVATIKKLVRDADVFSQGYRPGIMDKHGLSPEQLAKEHPGIIYLSISCYGHGGPFSNRGGWEQIGQWQPASASTTAMSGRSCCRPPPATTRPATTAPTACCSRWRGAHAKAARITFAFRSAAPACTSTSRATSNIPKPTWDSPHAELDSIMIESKGGHGTLKHLGPGAQNVRDKAVLGQAFSGARSEQSGMAFIVLAQCNLRMDRGFLLAKGGIHVCCKRVGFQPRLATQAVLPVR